MSVNTTLNQRPLAHTLNDTLERLGDKADHALDVAHNKADQAVASVRHGVAELTDASPTLLDQANQQLKHIARKSATVARNVSDAAKARAQVAADHASDRIRKDPLKSVLIAAAAGAALTVVATAAYKRRQGK